MQVKSVVDVGCGSGRALSTMCDMLGSSDIQYSGFDLSSQAISLSQQVASHQVKFYCCDFFESDIECPDLLLALDVFEHVPDYLGFLAKCQVAAKYKIYHIPLDIFVISVLLGDVSRHRENIGHLHYFTVETALETLQCTNHSIIEWIYTAPSIAYSQCKKQAGIKVPLKTTFANMIRRPCSWVSVPWSARLFGGYALLVLAE